MEKKGGQKQAKQRFFKAKYIFLSILRGFLGQKNLILSFFQAFQTLNNVDLE